MRSNGIYREIKHCTFTALRQYLTEEKLFGFDKNHCKRREKKFCWLIDKPQKFFAPLIRRKINSSNSGKFPLLGPSALSAGLTKLQRFEVLPRSRPNLGQTGTETPFWCVHTWSCPGQKSLGTCTSTCTFFKKGISYRNCRETTADRVCRTQNASEQGNTATLTFPCFLYFHRHFFCFGKPLTHNTVGATIVCCHGRQVRR